ncbi:MAG TPA: KamA family radical SAM protein [Candidatus Omnitrophota bacterium]|nr:KamA family radical SAM protein [Candidatus Omnitrophota bacterium]HPS20648.1 KamA family radical SAM protein [Candidatus Omnitrophota bacterium]
MEKSKSHAENMVGDETVNSKTANREKVSNNLLSEANWQTAAKNSIQSVDNLANYVNLGKEELPVLKQVAKLFHVRATHYYLSLIEDPYDTEDPIRKQAVPAVEELKEDIHEKMDPLAEEKTSPFSCLVHRYPDRALLIVTSRCFMYCRHCTRKRIWREKITEPTLRDIDKALGYVKDNTQIREVVISGGDPFTLSTERLDCILAAVSKCTNVEVVRIGTRAPVVLPQRIDDNLCKVLEKYDNLWINVQFNHPREITPESAEACRKLQKCGIPVSNQSVLLKGINDSPEIMMELCHKLQSIRVRPYYLFQCDPVVGASHFRTSIWEGIHIMEKMRGHTGGMCVPTFVVDGIDGKGKIPLSPNYLVSTSDDSVTLRNYKNEVFDYYNPKG